MGLNLTRPSKSGMANPETEPSAEESLEELVTLADSAGAVILGRIIQARPTIDAATLIGSGKVAEIQQRVEADEVDTVIFDHELTPTQLRNLERRLGVKVIDEAEMVELVSPQSPA